MKVDLESMETAARDFEEAERLLGGGLPRSWGTAGARSLGPGWAVGGEEHCDKGLACASAGPGSNPSPGLSEAWDWELGRVVPLTQPGFPASDRASGEGAVRT